MWKMAVPLVAGSAAIGAAYFGYKKVEMHMLMEEQYARITWAIKKLSATSERPVTILVAGFKGHGKTSLINTIFRVMYKEKGPLVLRANTYATTERAVNPARQYTVKNRLSRYPRYLLRLIEVPGQPDNDDVDVVSLEEALAGEGKAEEAPECVLVVMKTDDSVLEGPAWDRLPALAQAIRKRGLQFIIALTHRREAKKSSVDLKETVRDVASRAGTDLVFCLDNYVFNASSASADVSLKPSPSSTEEVVKQVKNVVGAYTDTDTNSQTLAVVLQCLEFARQRRLSQLMTAIPTQPATPALAVPAQDVL